MMLRPTVEILGHSLTSRSFETVLGKKIGYPHAKEWNSTFTSPCIQKFTQMDQ